MRLSRLPGYGLPELAFWPQPHYDNNKWWMHCLKLREDGSLHWHRRYVERDKPNVIYADDYVDYPTAKAAAIELNQNVTFDVDSLDIPDSHKESLRLKIEKALTAKSRLMDEEYLMYQVAIQKHANSPRPTLEELVLDEHFDSVAQELLEALNEMPYLQCVNIPTYRMILLRDSNNVWKEPTEPQRVQKSVTRNALLAHLGCLAQIIGAKPSLPFAQCFSRVQTSCCNWPASNGCSMTPEGKARRC
ncbi:hypothetical protein ACR2R9_003447 [Cronobacter sakazakii]